MIITRDRSIHEAIHSMLLFCHRGDKGGNISAVRLAMGGVAHKPWRLTAAENFLKGKAPSAENFKQAAALAMKDAKGYGHNNFKLKLAPNTIVQALTTVSTQA